MGAVTPITPAELDSIITKHVHGIDFFLIDVRDDNEIAGGIIASEHCKPYHMSLNSKVFEKNYQKISKTANVIIYCRSGARSGQAATMLVNAGYESVGSMTGGMNSYTGKVAASSEFKPLSRLPEPTCFGNVTAVTSKNPEFRIVVPGKEKRQQFTLQGRILRQQTGREQRAPIYVLERISGESSGKINGLHRLVQERE